MGWKKLGVLTVDRHSFRPYFSIMNFKKKMLSNLDTILHNLQDLYPIVYKRRYLFPELYASYQKQIIEIQRLKRVVASEL